MNTIQDFRIHFNLKSIKYPFTHLNKDQFPTNEGLETYILVQTWLASILVGATIIARGAVVRVMNPDFLLSKRDWTIGNR